MNNLKKCSIVLALMIGTLLFQPISEANALEKNAMMARNEFSKTILYEDENKIIIAVGENDYKQSYKKEIFNKPDFKAEELNKINLNRGYLPPGRIIAQRNMYKSDIEEMVDGFAGSGTLAKILSNPLTDASVTAIIKLAGFANPWAFVAAVLTWGAGDLKNRQESWWKDSLLMILKGEISCVRLTQIENTTSEYPKAYIIIERI